MADITVTPANVLVTSGNKGTGTAGETILAGQCLYLKASDSRLWKAQADGTVEEATSVGISLHGATAGQPVAYAAQDAVINIGGTTAKLTTYCVSAAAGGVAPMADLTSGQRISELGYSTDAVGAFVVKLKYRGVTV